MASIIIIIILVGFNAFFSMAEVAFISARRGRLVIEAEKGSRSARMAISLIDDSNKFLSTCQIGITVVSILTGIYSGAALSDSFTIWLQQIGLSSDIAPLVSKTVILIIATYLQCELGELFPKRIGIDMADFMAKFSAPPMLFFAAISKPFVWLMTINTNALVRLFHLHKEDSHVTEEEIKSIIREGTKHGEVEEVEQDIMERAMIMGDQKVDQIMTYRTEIVTLDVNMTSPQVEAIIHETPFANYPVVDGDIENICGFIRLKDLVMQLRKPDFNLRTNLQKPLYFPENITVYKALEYFKKYRFSFAFVCDEFGALQGIITLRNIFEGLVGTIEADSESPDIVERQPGISWEVYGQCPFYDFLEYFDKENLYQSDYNTLAGLILDLLDHIPIVGESCDWNGIHLHIAQMDGNRIDKVLVTFNNEEQTGNSLGSNEPFDVTMQT